MHVFRKWNNYISDKAIKLLFLLLLLAFSSYAPGHFLFVKAFSDQINLFPSVIESPETDKPAWDGINGAYVQDLSPSSGTENFNRTNSAFLAVGVHDNSEESEDDGINADEGQAGSGTTSENDNSDNGATDTSGEKADETTGENSEDIGGAVEADPEPINNSDGIDNNLPETSGNEKDSNDGADAPDRGAEDTATPESSAAEGINIIPGNENPIQTIETGPASAPVSSGDRSLFKRVLSFIEKNLYQIQVSLSNLLPVAKAQDAETENSASQGAASFTRSLVFSDFGIDPAAMAGGLDEINIRLSLAAISERSNDKIIVEYGFNDSYKLLGGITVAGDISNHKNGDYYSFTLPKKDLEWADFEDLAVRVTYESFETDDSLSFACYLDALWVEVKYEVDDTEEATSSDDILSDEEGDILGIEEGNESLFFLDLISEKTDFRSDEIPEFSFKFKENKGLVSDLISGILGLFRDRYENITIETFIQEDNESRNILIKPSIRRRNNGEFEVSLAGQKENITPGKHRLRIVISDGENVYSIYQDFSWGVLALNLDRSVYLKDQSAYLQLAVLDERGNTLCSVNELRIELRDPSGHISYLSTLNGEITENPACGFNNVIDSPDFYTYYDITEIGRYDVRVIALTENGTHEISDSFEAVDRVAFDIERAGPTRIYPWAAYRMDFYIRPEKDYRGEFTEYAPSEFKIVEMSDKGGVYSDPAGKFKELKWQVEWQKGRLYHLSYIFDAPDRSPDFFLLGPAKVDGFTEKRQWQLASDAENQTILAEQIEAMSHTAGNPTASLVTASSSLFTANNTYLVYVSASFTTSVDNVQLNYYINYGASNQYTGYLEPTNGSAGESNQISWFDVYTQPATPEDIIIRFSSVTGQSYGFNAQILAINLSDLDSGDWVYDEDTTSGEHSSGSSYDDYASITLSDADSEKDWFVIANEEVQIDSVSVDYQAHIYDGSNAYMGLSMEGENASELITYTLFRGFTDVATGTVFTLRAADEGSVQLDQNNHLTSRIIALNLDAFDDHKIYYEDIAVNLDTASWTEVGDLDGNGNYSPQYSGNQIIFASFMNDAGSGSANTDFRLNVNGTTMPTNWTYSDTSPVISGKTHYDARNESNNNVLSRTYIPSSGYSINLEGTELGAAGTSQVADEVSMVVFSTALEPPVVVSAVAQRRGDGSTIANGDWTGADVYLDATAYGLAATTSQVDFYYEVVSATSSFTTSTSTPASTCANGVSYTSCSSKIWKVSTSSFSGWWDDNYPYRREITFGTSHSALSRYYTATSTMDTRVANTNVALTSGDDVRIVWRPNSGPAVELDRIGTTWNSATTEIAFRLESAIAANANTDTDGAYWIYYGYASATSPPADPEDVYWFADFFDRANSTTVGNDWTEWNDGTSDAYITSNALYLNSNSIPAPDVGIRRSFPLGDLSDDFTVLFDWTIPTNNDGVWAVYMNIGASSTMINSNRETGVGPGIYAGEGGGFPTGNYIIQNDYNDGTAMESNVSGGPHAIRMRVDYSAQTYNYYRNGALVSSSQAFVNSGQTLNHIRLAADEYRENQADFRFNDLYIYLEVDTQPSVGMTAEEYRDTYSETLYIDGLPDSSDGYMWQVIVFDDTGIRSNWRVFNSTVPNFKVDTSAPSAPGDLTLNSKTSRSITVDFGFETIDGGFSEYKIFYKEGSSGVTTEDTEHDNPVLDYINYYNADGTTISGLEPETTYVINIWAYDQSNNKTSAENELVVTTSAPGRARSVELLAGSFKGTGSSAGAKSSDTNNTFSTFNFTFPESGFDLESAYLVFEAQIEAYSDYAQDHTGYNLAFDVCQEPCTANAFSGSGRVLNDDNDILSYEESESGYIRLLLDVTSETQLAAYTGTSQLEGQVGYRIETGSAQASIAFAQAKLVVTYTHDRSSPSVTNTVIYPLDSTATGDTGTRRLSQSDDCVLDSTCPLFTYRSDIPEYSSSPNPSRLFQWFEIDLISDGNAANDVLVELNIEGVNSTTTAVVLEASNGGDQGAPPSLFINSVPGYSENATQTLELDAYSPAGSPIYYGLGGEMVETYVASSTAGEKTRTVALPLGVIHNGATTASSTVFFDLYLPENGFDTGAVDIKSAWVRLYPNQYDSGLNKLHIQTRTGADASSSVASYEYDMSDVSVKPSFRIIHILPGSTASALEAANGQVPVRIWLEARQENASSATIGGLSAELMLTYTYTNESSGYLTSLKIFAGQATTTPAATTTLITSPAVFPEANGKTLLTAGLRSSYIISDSSSNMPSGLIYLGSGLSSTTAACVNSHRAGMDATNAFASYVNSVKNDLGTDYGVSYQACYTSYYEGAASIVSKPSGQLVYTYSYAPYTTVSINANNQYKQDGFTAIPNGDWTDESTVVLDALAYESASSTDLDFYFELVSNGSSLRSDVSVPTSSCVSGTSYGACSGNIWKSSASSSVPWYNESWAYRQKITINADQIPANQSDFPVFASSSDLSLAFSAHGGNMASSTAGDMVITDSDALTPLDFERTYYASSTGDISFWVKTDLSSSTNKTLYLYYGNPAAATDPSSSTLVWGGSYEMVHHLNETSGTHYDSTYNHNSVSVTVTNQAAAGIADGADDFNGTADFISLGDTLLYDSGQYFTMSGWFKAETFTTNNYLMSRTNGSNRGDYGMFAQNDTTLGYVYDQQTGGDTFTYWTVPSLGTDWHHFAMAVLNDGTVTPYLDGQAYSNQARLHGDYGSNVFHIGRGDGDYFDGILDELRISNTVRSEYWLATEYNNLSDLAGFLTFAEEESFADPYIEKTVSVTAIPDSSVGYKWQTLVCNDLGSCSNWDIFDIAPNFLVDTVPPTAPGNLSVATKTPITITVDFGTESYDANFGEYRIYYKKGLSGVTINDIEFDDPDLGYSDYGDSGSTTIIGLESQTQYVINIFAFDQAGNYTGATEIIVTTPEAPHARGHSVAFDAGFYSGDGTTGQNSDTDQAFSDFSFKLEEEDVEIRDAYIIFEAHFDTYADNGNYTGYTLGFDACVESCSASAWSGANRVYTTDTTPLAYDEDAGNQIRLLLDVSDHPSIANYSGAGAELNGQVGYRINKGSASNSIAAAKAKLIVTYSYNDDASESYTNTVIYPLDHSGNGTRASGQAGSCTPDSDCPLFSYNMQIPEYSGRLAQWYEMYGINDGHTGDLAINVNIEGTEINSNTYIHEVNAARTNEQGNLPMMMFSDVLGYSENGSQLLEYAIDGGTTHYLLGGEAYETYTASSSESVKTRTVAFPIGVLNNGQSVSTASGTVNVYFPENGSGSGVVDIKSAWVRVKSNDYNTGAHSITVSTKVGDNSQSANTIYNYDTGQITIKPSYTIIHIIPSADYGELEDANASMPKEVAVYTTNSSTDIGGVTAELMITYTYTDESSGYLSSIDLYAGQSDVSANSQGITMLAANSVFPELRGTETVRAAAVNASFLTSDSDAAIPADWFRFGASISTTSSPVCTSTYYFRPDGVNGFGEMLNNVLAYMETEDDDEYRSCISNTNSIDSSAGAKMAATWRYTYQWDAVPPEFTQKDWRWYENTDGLTPVTPLAAEKTSVSSVNIGDILRLRVNIGVTQEDLAALTRTFKLQYGLDSDCTLVSSWYDVGGVGATSDWRGYNNPDPVDGDSLSSALLASTTVEQTYEETNPTASNPNMVAAGGFSEWDFSLYNYNATSSSYYCFRLIQGDDTLLNDYLSDSYPKLYTAASTTKPDSPEGLIQARGDSGAVVPGLSWVNYDGMLLSAGARDDDISETVTMYFELKPNNSSFTTATSVPASPCSSGTSYGACGSKIWSVSGPAGDYRYNPFYATTSIVTIPESSIGYKWQAMSCDDDNLCSDWPDFGSAPDFLIDTTAPTLPGNLSFGTASPTAIVINYGATTTEANFSTYKIFYKMGQSGVTELDYQYADGNLSNILFNGAGSTTVSNLAAATDYVFNIWAYDLAGNKASATVELLASTTSSYTPPTGIFSSAVQKTDASGRVDITIQVDDADNDDTLRARIMYQAGSDCNFTSGSYSDITVSETDSDTAATYGDPKVDNNLTYQVGSSTGWIRTSPGSNYVIFDWLSKVDEPLANDTYCLGLVVNDGIYDQSATQTRQVLVDNVAPTAPGALSTSSVQYDNARLKFGTASADPRFSRYRIFYKMGTSGVTESDTEHVDSNLNSANYSTATSTLVTGLRSNTYYVFNIWAYDSRGNKASSTELTFKTNGRPTNMSADEQYYSDAYTAIPNGSWISENSVVLKASAHDRDLADNVSFYFELIPSSGTYTSQASVPPITCASGTAYSACSDGIWKVSTSTSSLPGDWYGGDWLYRKRIVIDSGQVSTTTTGFPVLATTTDSDLAGKARDDGYDIVFTTADGTSILPYQREYFNGTTGQLVAWVKTDISSTTDTILYMYYGNNTADTDNATTTGVWDQYYLSVWHLSENVVDESGQAYAHLDSSQNSVHLSQYGNNEVSGQIYRAQEFDGGSDFASSTLPTTATDNITISSWVKSAALTGSDEAIFYNGSSTTNGYGLLASDISNGNKLAVTTSAGDATSSDSLTTNKWTYVAMVRENGTWHLYVDGSERPLGSNPVPTLPTGEFRIGDAFGAGGDFIGVVDETRFSNIPRSSAWLETEYNNQRAVNDFLTIEGESRVSSYYEATLIISTPDSASGYKWQALACDDDGDCSSWDVYNTSIPNFKIDTVDPSAPGNLTLNSRTSNSVILNYGATTTEINFVDYKIYYSTTSPVTENDSEHDDSDLDHIDYNSQTNTTISGLRANTTYYFNIWAYDIVSHSASATQLMVTTNPAVSSPGVVFYTKGGRTLYYQIWDGSNWDTESSGPVLGSGDDDWIRHVRVLRSIDGGKVAILAKTWNATSTRQEWWGSVYRYSADDFVNTGQLGSAQNDADNNQLISGCLAAVSGGEFFLVRNNNASDGTLVYSWDTSAGWVSEGSGPDPAAVMNGCKLIRRSGTDNYLFVSFDDDGDVGTSYYYGGSTYASSWTTWTQHSADEFDTDNFVGDAFFDSADNTKGAINFSNSLTNNYTSARYFICGDSSINYGGTVQSPTAVADSWSGDWVSGSFAPDPGSAGIAYFVGSDANHEVNVYKLNISSIPSVWATTTNGKNISGSSLYDHTNDSFRPYDSVFYRGGNGIVLWNDQTDPSAPKYRLINSATNQVSAGDTDVPGAPADNWSRMRIYDDPNEDEFIAFYQNDNSDLSAVFFDGSNDRFYNNGDDPGSSQVWTSLYSDETVVNHNDELSSFAYTSYNSSPNSPYGLVQYKSDGISVIANQGWTNESSVHFSALVKDPDTDEVVKVYLELASSTMSLATSTGEPAEFCATSTEYNLCPSKTWLIASSTGDFSIDALNASATILAIPDDYAGYKWQVKACDDDSACSVWTAYNLSVTPNFRVDTVAPSAPGQLTVTNATSQTVTLNFGASTTEDNFLIYKIYYKSATSTVSESDRRHIDTDLTNQNYNGTTDTIVLNLSSSTLYYFNIWAYDLAGNKASATPEVATTTSALPFIRQSSYLLENDDASDVNSNSAEVAVDTALTDLYQGERLNVRIQIENIGGDAASNKVYQLQYENQTDSPGAWINVGAASEISFAAGLSGANGYFITSSKAALDSYSWVNGTWHENVAQTGSFSLSHSYYTEFVFAVDTGNAVLGKTYRLRLINFSDSDALKSYLSYPTLSLAATSDIRYSKGAYASLPADEIDLAYYFDPEGYVDISADDNLNMDNMGVTAQIPVVMFAAKHTNNSDAITVNWNGQSSVAPSANTVYLQVYKYGSPDQWVTIASNSSTGANTDFTLSATLNSSLASHYDASNWTYFRVYQTSMTGALRSDYYNASFAPPTADVGMIHFRWRNDNGSQTTATWREAEDLGDPTAPTSNLNKNTNIRLRFETANTGGGTASAYVYRIEYATTTAGDCENVDGWYVLPTDTSMEWRMVTSDNFANGAPTTAQLSNSESYSFVSGYIMESPSSTTSPVTLDENEYTEIEYVIQATNNAIDAGTYCFRVTDNGAELDAYEKYPLLTLSGDSNTAPGFSVQPNDGGSASTSPTDYGSDITFTATGNDTESDDYYLAICKNSSITAGNGGPPTCGGAGAWCISSLASSSAEVTCDYTAADAGENLPWYAFVCDYHSGFGIAKCSSYSQGATSLANGSPFAINHPPVFSSITTSDNNKDPGGTFRITTVSSDTDSYGGQDELYLSVCYTNSASFAGCAGGAGDTVCEVEATTTPNFSCTYTDTAPTPAGAVTYYAFLFDSHALPATNNSRSSTYTINNVAPSLGSGSLTLNGGLNITLNIKGSDTSITTVHSSVVDLNGCATLTSATAAIYYSNVTNGFNCTANDNNCYRVGTANCIKSDCTGADDQNAAYTCTASMKYFALPTDTAENNPYEPYHWQSYMNIFDGTNYTASTSGGVELMTNTALEVIEDVIDFGSSLSIGDNSGRDNATTTVVNAGNSPLDTSISGTDMVGTPSGTITVGYIKWSLTAGFEYTTQGTALTAIGQNVDILTPRPTGAVISDEVYWGIGIPLGTDRSTFYGQNTFSVILDSDGW